MDYLLDPKPYNDFDIPYPKERTDYKHYTMILFMLHNIYYIGEKNRILGL